MVRYMMSRASLPITIFGIYVTTHFSHSCHQGYSVMFSFRLSFYLVTIKLWDQKCKKTILDHVHGPWGHIHTHGGASL